MGIPSHLRCDQVVEIASDYLERALTAEEAAELEQHLLICSACAEYVQQLRALVTRAQTLKPAVEEAPAPASEQQLLAMLRRWKGGGEP